MKKKKFGLGIAIIILFVILSGFGGLVRFLTDYMWFKELGYTSVFFKQLFTQLKIGIPSFIIISILTYIYLRALKKGYYKKVDTVESTSVSEKALNRITLGFGAIFGIFVTLATVTRLWFEILKFYNSTSFNIADPIFNMDVSFYIFKLEFIRQINQISIGIVVAFVLLTVVYYFILLSLRRPKIFDPQNDNSYEYEEQEDAARRYNSFGGVFGDAFDKFGQAMNGGLGQKPKKHFNDNNLKELFNIASSQLTVLGIIFFIMVGANFYLKQYNLLYSQTGVLYGAGYTDINITLWVYRLLMVLSFIAAVMFVVGVKKRKFRTILVVPVIMILIGAVGSGAALLVQNLIVSPDEINKEGQYLENNIHFTQSAYDLQDVVVKAFAADNTLTKQDIQNNMGTISNIRINDYEPAKKFYNQTQSIRLYYSFYDVDVDRYMVNGEYTQTFLSAREIDENQIRKEWLNAHLKYTHGYGITLSRVDKVTASGQPDMLIDSIPPVSEVEEINITRPEIYFGELTNNYILTNTGEKEFDYPNGDNNKYATYEGNAGIKLNLFNRVLFAIREQSLKLLVSTNIDSDSKIIINRNIMDRIEKIMPFLDYDNDPYIVTVGGKLYWMIDAYTTSSYYPYSEPFDPEKSRINYIRNSVKIVIDAYNGDVNYYIVDDNDPIAKTYAQIYPKLFKSFDQMPEELRAHIRYPNTLFNIQANVYKRYHMNDVKVFYQDEDLWAVSNEIYGTKEVPMSANYYIMKLPGEDKVEFINSVPYTPRGKKNMTGLLVARNDGEHYGELIIYKLPKDKIIYGPMQIEAQIDQHTEISKEFSLWNSSGSTYTRGNMFVIPIEQSLLYVEPVYLEASNSSLPEVKRVIVAYGDRIAYEPTLAEALDTLFGDGSGVNLTGNDNKIEKTEDEELSVNEIISLANEAFKNATAAQQNGDWATYGQYLKQLEKYLNLLSPDSNENTGNNSEE
ncbi:UPF0182 family membrane protein [Anaerovorax odorimutans]|uniref:UPF0182 family membrane protein n=1 Tax=Anaerovorax odorimutans TaxID=109327 RepID=UPI00041E20F6|nr:UPF0182 family protein [Anaerovorax odorimutans]